MTTGLKSKSHTHCLFTTRYGVSCVHSKVNLYLKIQSSLFYSLSLCVCLSNFHEYSKSQSNAIIHMNWTLLLLFVSVFYLGICVSKKILLQLNRITSTAHSAILAYRIRKKIHFADFPATLHRTHSERVCVWHTLDFVFDVQSFSDTFYFVCLILVKFTHSQQNKTQQKNNKRT